MRHSGLILSHRDAFGRFCTVEESSGVCLFKTFKLGLELELSRESACLACPKGLGSVLSSAHTGVVVHTVIPTLRRQGDQEFKTSLDYSVGLRPAWPT